MCSCFPSLHVNALSAWLIDATISEDLVESDVCGRTVLGDFLLCSESGEVWTSGSSGAGSSESGRFALVLVCKLPGGHMDDSLNRVASFSLVSSRSDDHTSE